MNRFVRLASIPLNPLAFACFAVLLLLVFSASHAQVLSHQKISNTEGDFKAILGDQDRFGVSSASLGDLGGDGYADIAVGCYFYGYGDGHAGPGPGAVFVLSLNSDGTVRNYQLITNGQGGFTGILDNFDDFGRCVAPIGDLDGDGVTDLAVGANADDDGGADRGAVWLLFMNAGGTVKAHQKISDTAGGFTGVLDDLDFFGNSVGWLGDVDGDGRGELAVGASQDDDGGTNRGAVWILSLNPNGTVNAHTKISSTSGGFTGEIGDSDKFGVEVGPLGDLNGDAVPDLAVGAFLNDTGGMDRGAVWILFLNNGKTVSSQQMIASETGGFTGELDDNDNFGVSVEMIGNPGCGGTGRLAVGALLDDDGGDDRGAVWLLTLNANGTVRSHVKISETEGGFTGDLDQGDAFGVGVAPVGDLNADGMADIGVSAPSDDDGGLDRGALWILFTSPGFVAPSAVDFDTVQVGKDVEKQFIIVNQGCGVMIGDIVETCSHFSIVSETHYEIEPSESLTVTVRFAPEYAGSHECVVNAGYGLRVTLAGIGLEAPAPHIQTVLDVGNDQGRRVRVEFTRSGRDAIDSPTPVLQYEAYRRIDPLPEGSIAGDADEDRLVAERAERAAAAGMRSAPGDLLAHWEFAGAIPAHGDPLYFMIAPTLADSTVTDGMHWSVFFVRAATANPVVYFDSPADSGYSLDNLAPNVPEGFSVAYNAGVGNELAWDPSMDPDFRYFNVYRGTEPDFVPSPGNLQHQTVETTWIDPVPNGWQYHYKLTAVDFAGNESAPAVPGGATGVKDETHPMRFALHSNVPNPFNPSTTIHYDVPAPGGVVTIEIFDVNGRLVVTLLSEYQSEGAKSIAWRGKDRSGEDVASGVYLCRMRAREFERTEKIVLVR